MSSYHKDIGPATFFVYNLSHNNNRRPYLRRNVREVLGALNMGSTLSSLKSSVGARPREEVMASDDEEAEQQRPAKRRKLAQPDETTSASLPWANDSNIDQVTNETRRNLGRFSAAPHHIRPVDFYGRPSGRRSIDRCLPRTPVDFSESMRVDILQINAEFDESAPEESQWGQVADINCKCAVAIFYAKNDKNPGDVRPQDFLETCRLVQSCKYRVSISMDGEITREIILPEPFIFTPNHFFVNRGNDQYADGFGFADKYNIKVFIESKGSSKLWPGMVMISDSNEDVIETFRARSEDVIAYEDVSLYARTNPWFSAERHSRSDLHASCKGSTQKINYSLRMQIRWSLPSQIRKPTSRNAEQAMPEILQTTAPIPRESPRKAARRHPSVFTYNLKALSSIAQGRAPRDSRRQDSPHDSAITVTYCFGKAEAAETGIKRETTIKGLKCPFCLSPNRSLDELRLHLSTDHSTYKFHARRSNPPRLTFFVELAKNSSPGSFTMAERLKVVQLGRPVTLFDLEKLLNGDDFWTRARNGPLHNSWPVHLAGKRMGDSLTSHSSSPHESRYSSPNTSNDTDDLMDVENDEKDELNHAAKQRKVHYVPKTAKPLYDAVTKRLLIPGEVLPNSDDETDESWLYQQRRDGINDFTDIPPEEKEYINRFNPSILEERLTSMQHLPDVMLRFVETNKSWIVAEVARRKEFSKHMENFLLKGSVDENLHERCVRILIAEEKALKQGACGIKDGELQSGDDDDVDMQREEQAVLPKRGLHACICGEITMPPNRVVCRALRCPARFFCQPCAKGFGRPISGEWKCDSCLS